MTVMHHPPDDYLLHYAAGALGESEALVVACHATLCSRCRVRVHALEAIGGKLFEDLPSAEISDALLDRMLARARDMPPETRIQAPEWTVPAWLPAPLLAYLGNESALPWRRSLIGMRYIHLAPPDGCLRLWEFPKGMRLPQHGHSGLELHLILTGSASDDRDGRIYRRGDLMFNGESDEHSVSVGTEEVCFALALHVTPLIPRGWWSRVLLDWLNPRVPLDHN